jgi:cell division protein FtsI/penicillin-binding protein 2
MNPADGRVLAMVGFDKFDFQKNPCVDNTYPAASIFKIITAAAAIEKANLKADSMLRFNGRKHTLYKSQLTEKETKYTNYISFKEAFAKSINPVFGKLGALYLGKEELKSYAMAFGFNRIINFETFLIPSLTVFSDEPYQLAELASGFNKKTKITPVHGALIASTIVNQGKLIEPTIVNRIVDGKGTELYTGQSAILGHAFNVETSSILNELMKTTIKSGTARREFRKYRKDKVISRLEIGGKTGSINNRTNDVKYDWFVGYAKEKEGDGKIVVSVLVAHEKYIGVRAAQYALMAFKKYFRNQFDNKIGSSMQRIQALHNH